MLFLNRRFWHFWFARYCKIICIFCKQGWRWFIEFVADNGGIVVLSWHDIYETEWFKFTAFGWKWQMWFFDMRSNVKTFMADRLHRSLRSLMEREGMRVKIVWNCDQLVSLDGVRESNLGINKAFGNTWNIKMNQINMFLCDFCDKKLISQ